MGPKLEAGRAKEYSCSNNDRDRKTAKEVPNLCSFPHFRTQPWKENNYLPNKLSRHDLGLLHVSEEVVIHRGVVELLAHIGRTSVWHAAVHGPVAAHLGVESWELPELVHLRRRHVPGGIGFEFGFLLHEAEFVVAVRLARRVVHGQHLGPFGREEVRVVAVSGELEGRGSDGGLLLGELLGSEVLRSWDRTVGEGRGGCAGEVEALSEDRRFGLGRCLTSG